MHKKNSQINKKYPFAQKKKKNFILNRFAEKCTDKISFYTTTFIVFVQVGLLVSWFGVRVDIMQSRYSTSFAQCLLCRYSCVSIVENNKN